jgi:hypothetical protein
LAYDFAPGLFLLILFFHPDLVPKKSKIILGKKPFLKYVPDEK